MNEKLLHTLNVIFQMKLILKVPYIIVSHVCICGLCIYLFIDGLHVCIFCEQNCALLARPTQGMHMSTLCSTSSVTSLGH